MAPAPQVTVVCSRCGLRRRPCDDLGRLGVQLSWDGARWWVATVGDEENGGCAASR